MWWLATMQTRLLETALSAAVAADPLWPERVSGMEGARVRLRVLDTPLDVVFQPLHDRMVVLPGDEKTPVDLTITGSLADFLALAKARQAGKTKVGGVQLNGDLALGQQFEQALQALQPDWRIPLERVIGREAADILVRTMTALGRLLREQMQQSAEQCKDYLSYDAGISVSRPEWQAFVDDLQNAVGQAARIDARLKRLEANATCNG